MAVAAVNDDRDEWGYIGLTIDEKNCIGDALMDFEAPAGQWLWCQLYK